METRPADWLALIGCPAPINTQVSVLDADLATVTTDADRVLGIDSPLSRLAHIEFESGKNTGRIGRRLLRYNVLLDYRYDVPVESAVILLRRESDSPQITGHLERLRPDGSVYLAFAYKVIRLWEINAEELLAGGIGTLPLAPIAATAPESLPDVVRRMTERLNAEVSSDEEAAAFWASTYVLMGLKYPPEFTDQLLKGVRQMRESSTYQAILAEGRVEGRLEGRLDEARSTVLRLGGKRFGIPKQGTETALKAISSVETLEALQLRLLDIESWDELLAQ